MGVCNHRGGEGLINSQPTLPGKLQASKETRTALTKEPPEADLWPPHTWGEVCYTYMHTLHTQEMKLGNKLYRPRALP